MQSEYKEKRSQHTNKHNKILKDNYHTTSYNCCRMNN